MRPVRYLLRYKVSVFGSQIDNNLSSAPKPPRYVARTESLPAAIKPGSGFLTFPAYSFKLHGGCVHHHPSDDENGIRGKLYSINGVVGVLLYT
ncbi:MAG: hypothetical protein PHW13_00490 [Methylococcales bacterium]|nr:hypothetical protein [Methylococcales bacterium]